MGRYLCVLWAQHPFSSLYKSPPPFLWGRTLPFTPPTMWWAHDLGLANQSLAGILEYSGERRPGFLRVLEQLFMTGAAPLPTPKEGRRKPTAERMRWGGGQTRKPAVGEAVPRLFADSEQSQAHGQCLRHRGCCQLGFCCLSLGRPITDTSLLPPTQVTHAALSHIKGAPGLTVGLWPHTCHAVVMRCWRGSETSK